MKSKSLILMVISLGFGMVAAIGISQVLGGSKQPRSKEIKTGQVVVAKEIIEIDGLLTEDNCGIEKWPVEIIPETALKSLDEIKDKAVTTRIGKGLPLLTEDVVDKLEVVSLPIPPGYRAQAIKVAADNTIDGLLRPGDRIDIIVVYSEKKGNLSSTVAKTFLKNIQVFSIDKKTRRESAMVREASASNSKSTSILSVLVTEHQTEELALAQRLGDLQIVVRGENETDSSEADSLLSILSGQEQQLAGGETPAVLPPVATSNVLTVAQNGDERAFITRIWHGNQWAVTVFDQNGKPFSQYDLNSNSNAAPPQTNSGDQANGNDKGDSAGTNDDSGIWDTDQYRDN